jgi:hypothetical protein
MWACKWKHTSPRPLPGLHINCIHGGGIVSPDPLKVGHTAKVLYRKQGF